MSTNSLVAYATSDGKVTSSYVHYDGYTTGVGEMLLENYHSEELARELATTLGYASSLRETVEASHEDRANSVSVETYESYEDFEKMIRESSHLEYVYVWNEYDKGILNYEGKWSVASWTNTKKKVHNGMCFDYEYDSTWNGFEDLITVYIREGRALVKRYCEMVEDGTVGEEYLHHADDLEDSLYKWKLVEEGDLSVYAALAA